MVTGLEAPAEFGRRLTNLTGARSTEFPRCRENSEEAAAGLSETVFSPSLPRKVETRDGLSIFKVAMNLSKTVLPQPATVNWDIHSDRMFSRDRASPIPCDRRESRAKSRETLYPAPPDVPSSMSVGTPIPTSLRSR